MKTKHKLKIVSLLDATAVCSCGGWSFVRTGSATPTEIVMAHRLHKKPKRKLNTITDTSKSWRIPVPQYRCGNCGSTDAPKLTLPEVPHLAERLDVGGVVPAGECEKCGALTYLVPDREAFTEKMCAPVKVTDRSRDKFLAELLEIAQEARKLHHTIEYLDLGPKFRKQIIKRSTKICEWLLAIGDRVPSGGTPDTAALVDACWQLVRTIDSTGGLVPAVDSPMGMKAPAEDPEWIDLGEAYLAAKKALKSTKKNNGAAAIAILQDLIHIFGPDIDQDRSIPGTEAVDVLTDVVHRARKVLK